jgi:tRNA modification GTPase
LQAALRTLCGNGARLAEPGEFTLRAFLAGRLDLTQAEAVLGVIDARGDAALQTALRQLAGGLARPLAALRSTLIDLLADLEAGLDFIEEDIEFITGDEALLRIDAGIGEVQQLVDRLSNRAETSALPRLVLSGPPNSGKSSLFNALVERFGVASPQRALVFNIAGTTRDYLVARLEIDGATFEIVDTAGATESRADLGVEAAAQQTSHDQIGRADVVLHCVDSTTGPLKHAPAHSSVVTVLTKSDLKQCNAIDAVSVSSVTGAGLDQLAAELRKHVIRVTAEESIGMLATTSSRCAASLSAARDGLTRVREIVGNAGGDELAAAELREVLHHLGRVVGAVYTDDILDQIFKRFCIGK